MTAMTEPALGDFLRVKTPEDDYFGFLSSDFARIEDEIDAVDRSLKLLGEFNPSVMPLMGAFRARLAPIHAAIRALERAHRHGLALKEGDPDAIIRAAAAATNAISIKVTT